MITKRYCQVNILVMIMFQEKSRVELLVDREPETRSLIRWILENPFVSSINFHDGSVVVKLPKCITLSKMTSTLLGFALIFFWFHVTHKFVFRQMFGLPPIHNWLINILFFFHFKMYTTFKTVVEMCYFQKRKNAQAFPISSSVKPFWEDES